MLFTGNAETCQVSGLATWRSCIEKLHCHRFVIQSCVIQGSVYVAVAEQGLQGEDGHACIEQHGRAGMAELVRRDIDLCLFAKRLQARLAVAAAQGFVMAGEEIVG